METKIENSKQVPVDSFLWGKIYSLIDEFLKVKPWEKFENNDVFIVKSPMDNELYLCNIMGKGEREFGLNVFRGKKGIKTFLSLVKDGFYNYNREVIFEIDMISFSLVNQDLLDDYDLAITKNLKKNFPKNRWPYLRSYKPHYSPWYLNELEIETLCTCIERTLALYKESEKSLNIIRADRNNLLLLYKENKEWKWGNLKIEDDFFTEEIPDVKIDEFTIHCVNKLPYGLIEEIDMFSLPFLSSSGEGRPYYNICVIGIDEQYKAHPYGIFNPFTDYYQEAFISILQSFLKRGAKPPTVLLREGTEFANVFEIISSKLHIKCEKYPFLPHIEEFIDGFKNSIQNKKKLRKNTKKKT